MPSFEHGPGCTASRSSRDALFGGSIAEFGLRPEVSGAVHGHETAPLHRRPVRKLLCQAAYSVVEQISIVACEDLSASMQLAPYHHRDTHR